MRWSSAPGRAARWSRARWPGPALTWSCSKRDGAGRSRSSVAPTRSTVMPGCTVAPGPPSRSGDRRWCCRWAGRWAAPPSSTPAPAFGLHLPCSGAGVTSSVSAWPTPTSWDVVLTMRSKHCGLRRCRWRSWAATGACCCRPPSRWAGGRRPSRAMRRGAVAVASARSAAPATPSSACTSTPCRKPARPARGSSPGRGSNGSCTAPGGPMACEPAGPTAPHSTCWPTRSSSPPVRRRRQDCCGAAVLVGTRDWATTLRCTRQLCWPGSSTTTSSRGAGCCRARRFTSFTNPTAC